MSGQKDKTENRTGEYGGDDGALENERAETESGEDTDTAAAPGGKNQAERKQDKDLETGEENPAWGELDRLVGAAGTAPLVLYVPDEPGRYADHAAHGFAARLTKPLDLDALRALVGDLVPGVVPAA